MQRKSAKKKAWIVAADMGYGHQRTAYPLRDIAFGDKIINANNYEGMPRKDKKLWKGSRDSYEFISRFRKVPIIGLFLFLFLDSFQRILGYYPKRDLSQVSIGQKIIFHFFKRGWMHDLIRRLQKNPLPFVTTFFSPAHAAEYFNYKGDIYCIVCDADVNRIWAAPDAASSRIKYCVPNDWVRDRLKLYGVREENIFLTGFPLPKENIGGEDMDVLKKDLAHRILNLDPKKKYRKLYQPLIEKHLGKLPEKSNHPLTIMFSIGGAGAQKEIALQILKTLQQKVERQQLRFIISVGTRKELLQYFTKHLKGLKLGEWVEILYAKTKDEYFEQFNEALRTTDLLMTKPSELSFYAGLGVPIIIQPSIGSQEDFNRRWLLHTGAAILQENPKYVDQWIYDLLETGDFAEIAMEGFIEIEKMGAYNIERLIAGKFPVASLPKSSLVFSEETV